MYQVCVYVYWGGRKLKHRNNFGTLSGTVCFVCQEHGKGATEEKGEGSVTMTC